ncbi:MULTISPECIES: hypothetical protein [Cysteiniphilum]|uniref:Type IV pilus biogenesis protein PilP n=1 Tax=Cysteiniphilum litorale TaxID=2056700 RepID=A0A8J2Z4I5_9GAMM|nr:MULTISPECIES: hypothetical protein [Cysteiniphilum]GGF99249.1 hypothetical protein GCM10010995_15640 [Cysteiniphilum litorale]
MNKTSYKIAKGNKYHMASISQLLMIVMGLACGVAQAQDIKNDDNYVTQMKQYQRELALSSAQNEVIDSQLKREKMKLQLDAIKSGDATSINFASAQSSNGDPNANNNGAKIVLNKSQTFILMGVSGPSNNLVASLHYDNSLFPVKKGDDISGKWRVLEVMPSYVKLQQVKHPDDIRVVYLAQPVQESSDTKTS